ncbi:hypothetical protein [Nocardioides solisilvae]|uniref:hypothetical protein n=1 Tax=Nocardioides solisilvae TaxID=1542435 RepID=UPI000D74FBAF|nr:hypothetical protein [Nocardioides solisilvae]
MTEPTTLALAGAALAVALVLAGVLVRTRRRTARQLARAEEAQAALLARLEALEQARAAGAAAGTLPTAEFVITDVGAEREAPAVPARIEGRLFADLVLRESVVKAASWAHGVRRVLAPEVRSRLRAEMRRETRRSARRRRADVKEALRQYYARDRGDAA